MAASLGERPSGLKAAVRAGDFSVEDCSSEGTLFPHVLRRAGSGGEILSADFEAKSADDPEVLPRCPVTPDPPTPRPATQGHSTVAIKCGAVQVVASPPLLAAIASFLKPDERNQVGTPCACLLQRLDGTRCRWHWTRPASVRGPR